MNKTMKRVLSAVLLVLFAITNLNIAKPVRADDTGTITVSKETVDRKGDAAPMAYIELV